MRGEFAGTREKSGAYAEFFSLEWLIPAKYSGHLEWKKLF
jgi:hypothetical protein